MLPIYFRAFCIVNLPFLRSQFSSHFEVVTVSSRSEIWAVHSPTSVNYAFIFFQALMPSWNISVAWVKIFSNFSLTCITGLCRVNCSTFMDFPSRGNFFIHSPQGWFTFVNCTQVLKAFAVIMFYIKLLSPPRALFPPLVYVFNKRGVLFTLTSAQLYSARKLAVHGQLHLEHSSIPLGINQLANYLFCSYLILPGL